MKQNFFSTVGILLSFLSFVAFAGIHVDEKARPQVDNSDLPPECGVPRHRVNSWHLGGGGDPNSPMYFMPGSNSPKFESHEVRAPKYPVCASMDVLSNRDCTSGCHIQFEGTNTRAEAEDIYSARIFEGGLKKHKAKPFASTVGGSRKQLVFNFGIYDKDGNLINKIVCINFNEKGEGIDKFSFEDLKKVFGSKLTLD